MSNLAELGRRVAATQDRDRELLGVVEKANASFVRALRRRDRTVRPWLLAAIVASLFGVAAAVLALTDHPITVSIGNSAAQAGLGASVTAPRDREVPLQFSDGSSISLAPGASAVIASLLHNGGTLRINNGRAHVSVVHSAKARWAVLAGPYTITVTGTRFDVDWQPLQSQFVLSLHEGNVVVSGHTSHPPTQMTAGQQLVVLGDTWTIGKPSDTMASNSLEAPVEVASGTAPNDSESLAAPVSTSNEVSTPGLRAVPGWSALAYRGDYRAAFEAAEREGFDKVCRSSSASELLSLAEASRFSGHAARAIQALDALRSRYAGSEDAAVAAFQLGRLTTNGQQAAEWFRTYLREHKRGELTREAKGRLLEALSRAGDKDAARAAARDYLTAYPRGPHAAFATKLLNP
jgi:hypothetical protein